MNSKRLAEIEDGAPMTGEEAFVAVCHVVGVLALLTAFVAALCA